MPPLDRLWKVLKMNACFGFEGGLALPSVDPKGLEGGTLPKRRQDDAVTGITPHWALGGEPKPPDPEGPERRQLPGP